MADDTLPDDPATLKAMLLAERVRSERLEQIIKALQRHRFGRRAETLPEDQMLLGLEDVEQAEALAAAATEDKLPAERAAAARKRRMNRGSLPAHLPRIEMVVDVDDKTCPCCKGGLHRIGEDVVSYQRLLRSRQHSVTSLDRPDIPNLVQRRLQPRRFRRYRLVVNEPAPVMH